MGDLRFPPFLKSLARGVGLYHMAPVFYSVAAFVGGMFFNLRFVAVHDMSTDAPHANYFWELVISILRACNGLHRCSHCPYLISGVELLPPLHMHYLVAACADCLCRCLSLNIVHPKFSDVWMASMSIA